MSRHLSRFALVLSYFFFDENGFLIKTTLNRFVENESFTIVGQLNLSGADNKDSIKTSL